MAGIEIHAADGFVLRATLYDAQSDRALLIASAMGVKRRYYDAFAQFLAASGISVVTFDYRGIGDSRPASLRGFRGTLEEWGRLDVTAAIDWIARELRPRSLAYVGHSVGGQLAGLAPNIDRVGRFAFVCAQSGYWRHWPGIRAWGLGTLWIAMPLIARAIGYFPSRTLGLGSEPLPREVASEWARWGRHPEYLFGYNDPEPFTRITAPILAWSFAGDRYAPKPAVDALLRHYSAAPITRRHVTDRGLGHFDFFRRGKAEDLWEETRAIIAVPE